MAERILVNFGSLANNSLSQRGMAVVLALTGNVRFPNPPVAMAIKYNTPRFRTAFRPVDGDRRYAREIRVQNQRTDAENHLRLPGSGDWNRQSVRLEQLRHDRLRLIEANR